MYYSLLSTEKNKYISRLNGKSKTAFFVNIVVRSTVNGKGNVMPVKNGTPLLKKCYKNQNRSLASTSSPQSSVPIPICEVSENQQARLATGDTELDRVLGGGVVTGSLVLLAGERCWKVYLTATARFAGRLPLRSMFLEKKV